VLRVNCAVLPNSDGEDTENNPEPRLAGRHVQSPVRECWVGWFLPQWSPEDGMKGTGTRFILRTGPNHQDPARAQNLNHPPCLLRWGG